MILSQLRNCNQIRNKIQNARVTLKTHDEHKNATNMSTNLYYNEHTHLVNIIESNMQNTY